MTKYIKYFSLSLLSLGFTSHVFADTVNATITVDLEVKPSCSMNSLSETNVVLPFYFHTSTSKTINYSLNCTKGSTYIVEVNNGLHGTSSNDRKMKHETLELFIPYTILGGSSANYPVIGTKAEGNQQSIIGTGNGQTNYLYFFSNTMEHRVAQGKYSDTLRLTISY